MKLSFTAGKFEVETWTDGHPYWVTIRRDGEEIARGIHHSELRDLAYVLHRLATTLRGHMREQDRHELG